MAESARIVFSGTLFWLVLEAASSTSVYTQPWSATARQIASKPDELRQLVLPGGWEAIANVHQGSGTLPSEDFDGSLPSKANMGGWCATHGNVACILSEDVDTVTNYNQWKIGDHCEQLQAAGNLEVTQLPRAGATIKGLYDDGFNRLAHSLKIHTRLTQVGLQNNFIGAGSLSSLAAFIRQNIKIKVLSLGYNRLGPAGADVVAKAIMVQQGANCTVTDVMRTNGWQCPYKDYNNFGIEYLILNSNVLGDVGAGAIADLISGYQAPSAVWPFKTSYALKAINLRSNRITDVGATRLLTAITGNQKILELVLDKNPISPSLLLQINERLETNCCRTLQATIKTRCILNCQADTTLRIVFPQTRQGLCLLKCDGHANLIQQYYQPKKLCCKRIKAEKCK